MKINDNERKLYIPSKVNLKELILSKYNNSQRYLNDHQDKYAYVLSTIIELKIFGKIKKNGLVSLHAETLQKVLGGGYYKMVLDDLMDWNVIITDNHFKRDKKKSKGYNISLQYQSKAVEIMILKDSFAAKLKKIKVVNATKPASYIKSQLKYIHIRYQEALHYIQEKYDNTISLIDSLPAEGLHDAYKGVIEMYPEIDFYSVAFKNEHKYDSVLLNEPSYLKAIIIEKYNADFVSINNIEDRNFCFSVDKASGRVYTFITNLSKPLRQFLYHKNYRNEPLVNIDIRNSQPFVFCSLLVGHYCTDIPGDVKEYIKLCSSGMLYNVLMSEMLYKGDRKSFKQTLFATLFYCKVYTSDTSQMSKYFRNRFPSVYAAIRYYKIDDYKNLSRMMQTNEAFIMIENVTKALSRDSVFLSTIHDSVLTLSSNTGQVMDTIMKYFKKLYKIVPALDVEQITIAYQAKDEIFTEMAA